MLQRIEGYPPETIGGVVTQAMSLLPEVAAIDQFHDDVELPVIFAHRKDLDDVRMLDRRGDAARTVH